MHINARKCEKAAVMGTGTVEEHSSNRTIGIVIVLQPPLLSHSPFWPAQGCEGCNEPGPLL